MCLPPARGIGHIAAVLHVFPVSASNGNHVLELLAFGTHAHSVGYISTHSKNKWIAAQWVLAYETQGVGSICKGN